MYLSHLRAPKTQPHHIPLREFSFSCPNDKICLFVVIVSLIYYVLLILQRGGGGRVKFVHFKVSQDFKGSQETLYGPVHFFLVVGIHLLIPMQTYKFLWPYSLAVPVLAGWVSLFVVLCPGTPKGSTDSCSGFKASQKTGQQLKVSSDRLGEARNLTCDPWLTRHRFIPYTTAASPYANLYHGGSIF